MHAYTYHVQQYTLQAIIDATNHTKSHCTSQHVYAKHFTVMNYRDPARLKQINCEDFVPLFDAQYPDHKWAGIEV